LFRSLLTYSQLASWGMRSILRQTSVAPGSDMLLKASTGGLSRGAVDREAYEEKCVALLAVQRNYETVSRTLHAKQAELEQVE
jgi:hypothetical protein